LDNKARKSQIDNETSKNHAMSKKIKKRKGLDRIKSVRTPKNVPHEKKFLALMGDELLDEVSLEIEVMAIMDEKDSENKTDSG
jgi:hypothetical protein